MQPMKPTIWLRFSLRAVPMRLRILLMAFCSAKSRTLQVFNKMTSAFASDRGERIAFGDELGGDGFAVALVHLATVSFDENTGHDFRETGLCRKQAEYEVKS